VSEHVTLLQPRGPISMHVHLPKPLHGWRAILGEVGIIVVGILIALALEQLVQVAHERTIATEAREAVRAEVGENLWWMEDRRWIEPCVRSALREVDDVLVRANNGQPYPVVRHIGLDIHSKITDLRWQANSHAGRASLFTGEEQRNFDNMYFTTNEFREAQEREENDWARLRAMQGQTHLTPRAVEEFRILLEEARYENFRVLLSIWRSGQWAAKMHLTPNNPNRVETEGSARRQADPECTSITKDFDRSKVTNLFGGIGQPEDIP
jgi:hypothetical protein